MTSLEKFSFISMYKKPLDFKLEFEKSNIFSYKKIKDRGLQ